MRNFTLCLSLAALAVPTLSHAAEPAACLTAGEFTAVARYALPSAINGTAQKCGAALGDSSYLKKNGSELAARYAAGRDQSWPATRAALKRLGGVSGNADAAMLFNTLPDEHLRPLVDTMITGAVAQRLPAEQCGAIDRLVNLLAPLPPESTAEIIAIAAGLGAASGKARIGKFALCPPA